MDAIPLKPLIGAFGAECRDLDIGSVDPALVRGALCQHQLLVVRDQDLSPDQLTRFAAGLGELDRYPFAEPLKAAPHVVPVVKEPEDTANFGGAWHTDTAYLSRPPSYTVLLAKEVPEHGGDTLFADLYGAYAGLSAAMRDQIDSLRVKYTASLVHDADGAYATVAGAAAAQKLPPKGIRVATDAVHPLVRVHPESGRRALYLSLIHIAQIVGMNREDSLILLEPLHAAIIRAELCTRLRWRPGTLAIWDNRCLLHYPLNDYPGRRREMHRVIVKGEVPQGVEGDPSASSGAPVRLDPATGAGPATNAGVRSGRHPE